MHDNKDKKKLSKDEIKNILNLINLQKLDLAKEEVEEIILKHSKSPILFNLLGAILFKQNKPIEAINNYNFSIKLDSNYAQAYNNLGTALHHVGKQQDAIKSFKKAINLKNDFIRVDYWNTEYLAKLD
mgnify:CR=1 FL=1